MAKLIYSAIASLDGYVADQNGEFGWAAPDEEVHRYVNDLERPIGTYLYGRRMYEVMAAWETIDDERPSMRDYAEIWRSAEKVVFSKTLGAVASPKTRIEPDLDPDAIRRMKAAASSEISVGGPDLAGQAIAAGLVDECHLFLAPVAVGGGKPVLPLDGLLKLDLLGQNTFPNGTIHLHYRLP